MFRFPFLSKLTIFHDRIQIGAARLLFDYFILIYSNRVNPINLQPILNDFMAQNNRMRKILRIIRRRYVRKIICEHECHKPENYTIGWLMRPFLKWKKITYIYWFMDLRRRCLSSCSQKQNSVKIKYVANQCITVSHNIFLFHFLLFWVISVQL